MVFWNTYPNHGFLNHCLGDHTFSFEVKVLKFEKIEQVWKEALETRVEFWKLDEVPICLGLQNVCHKGFLVFGFLFFIFGFFKVICSFKTHCLHPSSSYRNILSVMWRRPIWKTRKHARLSNIWILLKFSKYSITSTRGWQCGRIECNWWWNDCSGIQSWWFCSKFSTKPWNGSS